MDLNHLFTLMVGLAAIGTIVRMFRVRSIRHRRWMVINALLLVLILVGSFLFRESVGYIAITAWFLLLLVPALLSRWIAKALVNQSYGLARRLSRLVRVLHPFDEWKRQPEFFQALDLAQRGDFERAEKILGRYRSSQTALGRTANTHYFRMKSDWEGALHWLDSEVGEKAIAADPLLLPTWLRALGETGQLSRLLGMYEAHGALLSSTALGELRPLCQLMVFAFSGREKSVQRLLQGAMHDMPEQQQRFWQSTAGMAAGGVEKANAEFLAMRDEADPAMRIAIDRRLSKPVATATQTTTEKTDFLAALELELEEEERYGRPERQTGVAIATVVLAGTKVFVFGLEVFLGGSTNPGTLLMLGAVWPPIVVYGEWWRIIAAQFLHWGPIHLVMNLMGLMMFGPFLETTLGRIRYLLVYLVSGAGGMLILVSLHMNDPSTKAIAVGASGGVMGLVGATAGVMLLGWLRDRAHIAKRRLMNMVSIVAMQTLFDFAIPEVSFTVHMSGALIGFASAIVLGRRPRALVTD